MRLFNKTILVFTLALLTIAPVVLESCGNKNKACSGEADCSVCTDCSRCKYCSKKDNSCGVCNDNLSNENY